MQKIIRRYKGETGEKEVDMHKVAEYAKKLGWPMPKPANPIDLLAKEFSAAAREEIRYDTSTGKPYRANHAYYATQGDRQLTLWVDIDEAPRGPMQKSLVNRREQMVGDAVQLSLDVNHWNGIHPQEDPIVIPMDFTDDVEWRLNAPDEDKNVA
jgi:hypothetical protein